MANCLITGGRDLPCGEGLVSGYVKAYFINKDSGITFTIVNGTVTAITGLDDVFMFELAYDNTANTFNQTSAPAVDGPVVFTQTAVLNFRNISVDMNNQMMVIASSRPWVVLEDNSGRFHLMGLRGGVRTSNIDSNLGTLEEFQGYVLTLESKQGALAPLLGSTASTTLLAAVAPNS